MNVIGKKATQSSCRLNAESRRIQVSARFGLTTPETVLPI